MRTRIIFNAVAPSYACACIDAATLCDRLSANAGVQLSEKEKQGIARFCSEASTDGESLRLGEIVIFAKAKQYN